MLHDQSSQPCMQVVCITHAGSRRSAASSDFKLHWAPGVDRQKPVADPKDVNTDLAGIASAGISKLRSMSSLSKEQVATLSQKGTSRGDRSPRTQGSATAGTFEALMPAMGVSGEYPLLSVGSDWGLAKLAGLCISKHTCSMRCFFAECSADRAVPASMLLIYPSLDINYQ